MTRPVVWCKSYQESVELREVFKVLGHVSGQYHVDDGRSHLPIGSSVGVGWGERRCNKCVQSYTS